MAAKKKRKKRMSGKRKVALVIVEILVLLIVLAVLFVSQKMAKIDSGNKEDIVKGVVQKNDLHETAVDTQEKYKTIAFFGLDNRSVGSLDQGNSDVIIVASINESTKEVKMASIYRDTYVDLTDGDGYRKCNAAYAHGGPSQAVSMLNVNFDLDIDDYVTFDFNTVADAVDLLGGVEIELTNAEANGINGYIEEVARLTGKEATYIYGGGTYNMDGVQATSYARIRYTPGDDYKRTERQRLVIQKMVEKALQSDLATLNSLVDTIFPEIKTSLTNTEILALAKDAFSYSLGENAGFPLPENRWAGKVSGEDVVVACELTDMVVSLHEFLFEEEEYVVSPQVQEVSDAIVERTGIDRSQGELLGVFAHYQ